MRPPVILGLDLAEVTGWAVGPPGERPEFGARRWDYEDPEGKIFSDLATWLEMMIGQRQVTHVFTEAPFMGKDVRVSTRLMGMRAITRMVAWESGARFEELHIATIAKFFTGVGKFRGGSKEKKAVTIAMAKAQGYDVGKDHNKADGIAVWTLGEATAFPAIAAKRGIGPLFLAGHS